MEPSASDPPPRRFRITDQRLLDAATAVFAADGFDAATMDALAARARVTKPTLYARFGSKEDLYAAAVLREYAIRKQRLFASYEPASPDEPFRSRVHRWTVSYFDLVRERPDGFRLIAEGERHPAAAAIVAAAGAEILDRVAALVRGVSGRDADAGARVVAAIVIGMLTSGAREAVRARLDLDSAAALCESLVLHALRGVDPDLIDGVTPRAPGAPTVSGRG